jgi:hypothetical protein
MDNLDRILTATVLMFFYQGQAVAAESAPVMAGGNGLELHWTTPSKRSSGSMPLGNGDISVMAWAEADGDLLLYVGKCDSWDENGRLLKLGRLRLHFSQQPFAGGKTVPPDTACRSRRN